MSFFWFDPAPFTQFRDPGCARLLGEPLGLRGKVVVFLRWSGRGSNPEPRASEEDALSTPPRPTWPGNEYSLSLFDHFCPMKRNGEYFAKKWSEQKVLIIKVAGLYTTYQKYKRIGGPSSYQFRENWT